jgi:hypothetical protein
MARQLTFDGPFVDWQPIGNQFGGGSPLIDGSPAVSTNLDGSLHLFARGPDGKLGHMVENGPNTDNWSGWHASVMFAIGDPVAVRDTQTRARVICRGLDRTLNDLSVMPSTAASGEQLVVDGATGGIDLGIDIQGTGDPTVAIDASGALVVAVRAMDYGVSINQSDGSGIFHAGNWQDIGGITFEGLALALDTDNTLKLVARGTDNRLWFAGQTGAGAPSFVGWQQIPNQDQSVLSDPIVMRNDNGSLEAFAIGLQGDVRHFQSTAPGAWVDLGSLGGVVSGSLAGVVANHLIYIFGIGLDGRVWFRRQNISNTQSDWQTWTAIGEFGIA